MERTGPRGPAAPPGAAPDAPGPPGSLRRSVQLLRAFRREQVDPDHFYSLLAADSVQQLGQWVDLEGRLLLDVGGGPGYFAAAFRGAGADYVAVDPDLGELSARERPGPGTVLGSGLDLPVRDSSVDVAYSSNVVEHVARPERMAEEMLRVVRPGGLAVVSYMLWLGPYGGHETSPWHYIGGERAARRYERRNGAPPKNRYGETLFPTSAARMLRWARTQRTADVLAAQPRYHPTWAHWVVRVPGLREVAAWNLLLVLRKR
jgi:arabinofuranan 3-O-arabinosyltransferase